MISGTLSKILSVFKSEAKVEYVLMDPKQAKAMAKAGLESLGNRAGTGVGALKVLVNGKPEVKMFNNAEEFKAALQQVVSGKLKVVL